MRRAILLFLWFAGVVPGASLAQTPRRWLAHSDRGQPERGSAAAGDVQSVSDPGDESLRRRR